MSVAVLTPTGESKPLAGGLTVTDFLQKYKWWLLGALVLLGLLYAKSFAKLWSDWSTDENYSHGYLVPVAFAWMIWMQRKELGKTEIAPRTWGLLIVALGVVQMVVGKLGAENFVTNSSLLVVLTGVTIYLFGMAVLRRMAFPIAWLIFMIPLPAIIYYALTFRLQVLASSLSSTMLDLARIPNVREGNVIYLPNFTVGVVEACSGIRSLISLLAFAAFFGYVSPMNRLSRWILILSAVPIAIFVNALRIGGTGCVGNYASPKYAEGFYHTFSGWLLFLGCLGSVALLSHILTRLNRPRDTEKQA